MSVLLERGGITLSHMTEAHLEPVLAWRNDDQVRVMMLKPEVISWEDHCKWFEATSKAANRALLVAARDGEPFGFAQLTWDERNKIGDWGFHVSPAASAGSGTMMCAAVLDFAFGNAFLHKVCGQVLLFNEKSLALHRRLGFTQEGVLRSHHLVDGKWHDIVCFGILEDAWAVHSRGMKF
jgi:UDP-4-amino-4,6-dideoxy-N-acetyl-beta-L-altrosamine N-acetyltransferase